MKKVYLHVGLHKTATSYLQKFLSKNQKNLQLRSFDYIDEWKSEEQENHHRFAKEFKENKVDSVRIRSCLDKIGFDNIIISSEIFSEANYYINLPKVLSNYDVRPVIYLRRNDHLNESGYSQRVKQSNFSQNIYMYRYQSISLLDQIYKWGGLFGFNNLIVRSYNLCSTDIANDFLQALGIDDSSDFSYPVKENVSPNKNIIFICYLINCVDPKLNQNKKLKIAKRIASELKMPDSGKYFMSPVKRSILYNEFGRQNKIIKDLYFGEKMMWSVDFNDDPDWKDLYIDEKLIKQVYEVYRNILN